MNLSCGEKKVILQPMKLVITHEVDVTSTKACIDFALLTMKEHKNNRLFGVTSVVKVY